MPTIRAWIKPLQYVPREGRRNWQYYARVDRHARAMGSATSYEDAHDAICDYVYGLLPGYDDWSISYRESTHA